MNKKIVLKAQDLDGYLTESDKASLDVGYRLMHDAYTRIFTRMGLKFRAVLADPGAIGGTGSQEFHVLAASGEDAIVACDACQCLFVSQTVLAPRWDPVGGGYFLQMTVSRSDA